MSAQGFAVWDGGQILIKTVSDTKRAAMVNWLAVEARIVVWHDWSDEKIAGAFDAYAFSRGARVVAVKVEVI